MRHVEEVLNQTGLTYRQLDYWSTRGWLKPLGLNRPGSGNDRTWPPGEIRVATIMRRLTEAGMSVPAAHNAARIMVDGKAAVIGPGLIVADVGAA